MIIHMFMDLNMNYKNRKTKVPLNKQQKMISWILVTTQCVNRRNVIRNWIVHNCNTIFIGAYLGKFMLYVDYIALIYLLLKVYNIYGGISQCIRQSKYV